MDDKQETWKQWSMEALACLCEHPNVIKFLVVHKKTIEAYTCGGMGELFKKCWITT
jgi:hypothetical protein